MIKRKRIARSSKKKRRMTGSMNKNKIDLTQKKKRRQTIQRSERVTLVQPLSQGSLAYKKIKKMILSRTVYQRLKI